MRLFPFLESNQCVALVEKGIRFPEVFLIEGEKNGEGCRSPFKVPYL